MLFGKLRNQFKFKESFLLELNLHDVKNFSKFDIDFLFYFSFL
jgi:hypothetical protein